MPQKDNVITISNGDDVVKVFPRKSRMAKRIIISVTGRKGFELIVPTRVSMKRAIEFVHKKHDWILARNRELNHKPQIKFTIGTRVPMLGNVYNIVYSGNLRGITKIDGDNIIISGLEGHIPRKTKQFLIKQAKEVITMRAEIEAAKIGVKFGRITIRDTTSRWGSCSQDRNLSFSWRLVLAPRFVMEYVVAHEVAHIVEMNHSKKFWGVVAGICPEHHRARYWLRQNGEQLHLYGDAD